MTGPHQNIPPTLTPLAMQPGEFEILLVTAGAPFDQPLPELPGEIRLVSTANAVRGALLHAGALAARGDALLFLWPGNRLPVEALVTIERNLTLLPQTLGGNFHVSFENDSLAARLITRFIKKQRYQGHYFGNSGIFVRKEIYEALGGFRPYDILEDYDFGRRLEAAGPTLYLPDKIVMSTESFKGNPIRAALAWGLVLLLKLDVHPNRLASLARALKGA